MFLYTWANLIFIIERWENDERIKSNSTEYMSIGWQFGNDITDRDYSATYQKLHWPGISSYREKICWNIGGSEEVGIDPINWYRRLQKTAVKIQFDIAIHKKKDFQWIESDFKFSLKRKKKTSEWSDTYPGKVAMTK